MRKNLETRILNYLNTRKTPTTLEHIHKVLSGKEQVNYNSLRRRMSDLVAMNEVTNSKVIGSTGMYQLNRNRQA